MGEAAGSGDAAGMGDAAGLGDSASARLSFGRRLGSPSNPALRLSKSLFTFLERSPKMPVVVAMMASKWTLVWLELPSLHRGVFRWRPLSLRKRVCSLFLALQGPG